MRRLWLKKVLLAAAVVALGGMAACVVPASTDVVVGRRVTVSVPEGVAMPDPEAVVESVSGGSARVMAQMENRNGARTLIVEVWGDDPPGPSMTARIRAAHPALAGADIREEALEGTVKSTLGKKLGRELFDVDLLDKGDVETARRQVMAALAARGVAGKVDVQIEGEGGEHRVKVRVEAVAGVVIYFRAPILSPRPATRCVG